MPSSPKCPSWRVSWWRVVVTPVGTALNDVASELGNSLGAAVVGTIIAALVATQLPEGAWSHDFLETFFHGERVTYLVVAAMVAVIGGYGCSTLTESHRADEH